MHKLPGSPNYSRFPQRYLASLDALHLNGSVRIGRHFLGREWRPWLVLLKRWIAPWLKPWRRNRPVAPATVRKKLWNFPTPDAAALDWCAGQVKAFGPDIVIADYFSAAAVFPHCGAGVAKAILLHDVLAARKESFESAGLPLDFDPALLAREAESLASADLCLAITPEEAELVRSRLGVRDSEVFPYVTGPVLGPRSAPSQATECLFVGSNNAPNRLGLEWLLRTVWPLVLAEYPQAQLRVAGRVSPPTAERLPHGVDCLGPVSDLSAEYARSRLALVPLIAGSGLKIKLVEALVHATPVVATPVGAAGLPEAMADFGSAVIVANQSSEFAQAIVKVLGDPEWGRRSRAAAMAAELFGPRAADQAITKILDRPLPVAQGDAATALSRDLA